MNPNDVGINPPSSSPGMRRLNTDAASIKPAAKPFIKSKLLRCNDLLINKIGTPPEDVAINPENKAEIKNVDSRSKKSPILTLYL